MSSIYSTEPPTKGKVILHTTSGDVDVELWPKEAPRAVRNFVQLCLEGYFDGCLFHRVVKDLVIQTGDPTGTGLGGESVFGGEPFGDELHSRLRFTRRGLVAMAGSSSGGGGGGKSNNKGNTTTTTTTSGNGSQFFITLAATPHLDRQHTIFGRVAAGDTIYTVAAIGEAEVDEADRPCSEPLPRIVSAEVLWNPFDDIVPRTTAVERAAARAREAKGRREAEERAAKPGLVAVRDRKLLSFGDGEEEDDDESEEEEEQEDDKKGNAAKKSRTAGAGGMVSAHEAALGDSRLVAPDEADADADAAEAAEREVEREAVRERLRASSKKKEVEEEKKNEVEVAAKEEEEEEREGDKDQKQPPPPSSPPPPASTVSSRRAAALERGAQRSSALPLASGREAAARARERDAPLLTEWQRRHARFTARKRATGKRDDATMRALDAFTARLRGGGGGSGGSGGGGNEVPASTAAAANNNSSSNTSTTAAKAGAAVAAAAFIEQGDVSLREVARHKMVARREEEEDDDDGKS